MFQNDINETVFTIRFDDAETEQKSLSSVVLEAYAGMGLADLQHYDDDKVLLFYNNDFVNAYRQSTSIVDMFDAEIREGKKTFGLILKVTLDPDTADEVSNDAPYIYVQNKN